MKNNLFSKLPQFKLNWKNQNRRYFAVFCALALTAVCILLPYISSLIPYTNKQSLAVTLSDGYLSTESPIVNDKKKTQSKKKQIDLDNSDNRSSILQSLYSRYAVIMDADNGRILLGKNETTAAPNASTTKIMTCIIALEYGNYSASCTTSKYAASMPDVQLNASTGEIFALHDLLYSLMLKSHNDTAVIIAENVASYYVWQVTLKEREDTGNILNGKDLSFVPYNAEYNSDFLSTLTEDQSKMLVSVFAGLMNQKANDLGCTGTHFITPNGLDAEDDTGVHSTTPTDLATIMRYCIQNQEFLTITETTSYSFGSEKKDSSGTIKPTKKNYSVNNANAFLNMYDNIISGKTGFTGDAGYCYVCAYRCENRTFVVVLLACGWPNNKNYKWHDARLLLNWAREKYFQKNIIDQDMELRDLTVNQGFKDSIPVHCSEPFSMLLSDFDTVNVTVNVPERYNAPIKKEEQVGTVNVYVNDYLVKEVPVYASEDVEKTSFLYYLKKAARLLTFCDN